MKNIYTFKKIVLAIIATSTIVSCERNSTYEDAKPSIANIAVTNSAFSTLEAAAVLGGVAGVLSNPNDGDPSGKFTVFAPTNDAFAKLGLNPDTLGALNGTFLTNTLLYHVSNGNLMSGSFLPATPSASALGGITRRFIERNGEKYINGSKIIATNIAAANGTVHAIDKVMIATGADIVNSALAVQDGKVFVKPELTYLVQAVLHASPLPDGTSIATALSTLPSLTVFAPTDAAFIELLKLLNLPFANATDVKMINPDTVRAVLLNHVIGGGKFTSELNAGANAALGGTLTLGEYMNGVLSVKGPTATIPANMVIPDIQAKNGVIHIIDRVLL